MKKINLLISIIIIFVCCTVLNARPKHEVLSLEQTQKGDIASTNIERIICYKGAIESWPQNYNAMYKLGKVYLNDGKETEALGLMNKAMKSGDDELQLRVYKAIYKFYNPTTQSDKDHKNSNKWLRKIAKLEPNFLNYYNLGLLNGEQGLRNYRDSINFFKKAYQLKSTHKIILFYIAESYYYLKDYAKAVSYIQKYPNANKNHQNAFKLFVKSYYLLARGNCKYSVSAYGKCKEYLRTWPNDKEVKLYYGDLRKKVKPFIKSQHISKTKLIPISKEKYNALGQNEIAPKIVNNSVYYTIKETFHVDLQKLVNIKSLNLKPYYNYLTSKKCYAIGNKYNVEIYAVNLSSSINRNKLVYKGIISNKSQIINFDFNKKVKFLLIKVSFDKKVNEHKYTLPPVVVTVNP